jgi:hypothetical protein
MTGVNAQGRIQMIGCWCAAVSLTHSDNVCEVSKVAAELGPGAKLEFNTKFCCVVEISLKKTSTEE